MNKRVAGCLAAWVVLLAGCGGGDSPESRPNLLLVTLDTTRADRIGAYGDAGARTTALDRVADEGMLVEQCSAPTPLTLPSHATILTGRYPPSHGIRDNGDFRLPGDVDTLAEHLRGAGYSTGAVVAAFVLDPIFGLDRGFDSYLAPAAPVSAPIGAQARFEPIATLGAEAVTDRALDLLVNSLTPPFFLWVHYYDPHAPYDPPEPFRSQFPQDPYRGEIARADAQLARLLAHLERDGQLDRTVTVVTADHGEGLGDHGEATHGLLIYEEALHVPLAVRFPARIEPGLRIAEPASLADVAPTVLDLMGLPPLPMVQGRSLVGADSGGPVYAEAMLPMRAYGWAPLYALRRGQDKFILSPEPELFDLEADPDERRNRIARGEDPAPWLRALEALRASFPAVEAQAEVLDEESRARLRSLGYVAVAPQTTAHTGAADPKARVALHNAMVSAVADVAAGRAAEAAEKVARVLEQDPANPAALSLNGVLAFSTGDRAAGLERLRRSVELAPDVYESRKQYANALHVAGRLGEAEEQYRRALAIRAGSGDDHFALANVLAGLGRTPEALQQYDRAVELGWNIPFVEAARGAALDAAGRLDEARAAFERAARLDPTLVDAWNQLGVVTEKSGALEEARRHYERALELRPSHPQASFNYSKVSLRMGDLAAARRGLDRFAELGIDYALKDFLEAQVALAEGDREAARLAIRRFVERPDVSEDLRRAAWEMLRQAGG